MVTSTTIAQKTEPKSLILPKKISWTEFERKYLQREDRYKYEWVNGIAQKTPRNIDQSQAYILANLIRFLYALKAKNQQIDGDLIAESDTFFAGNHRRPDIAFYTSEQLKSARYKETVNLDFVIEVISKRDQMETVMDKMEDYRTANVKVIWHIFPRQKQVHVYHGKNMTICTGEDICSADSVIEGFEIMAKSIFD
jgi:Uma2 family endonuclease